MKMGNFRVDNALAVKVQFIYGAPLRDGALSFNQTNGGKL